MVDQFRFRHPLDNLFEPFEGGNAANRRRPVPREIFTKIQGDEAQHAHALGHPIAAGRLRHQGRKPLRHRMRRRQKMDFRSAGGGPRLEEMPLGQRQETADLLGRIIEPMQRRLAQLTGANHAVAGRRDDNNFALRQRTRKLRSQPISGAPAKANETPRRRGVHPLLAGWHFDFFNQKMSGYIHLPR